MNEDMFEKLRQSVEQAAAHASGEQDFPDEQVHIEGEPDPRAIRDTLGLTQDQFAEYLNVPVATLRNWEQGRRTPQGPAKMLLKIAATNPKAILKARDEQLARGNA